MSSLRIELPQKIRQIFRGKARYRGAYGGRGSGKSVGFARMCLILAYEAKRRILCAREIQSSIRDSVLQELITQAYAIGLDHEFDYGENYFKGKNGSQFLFKGIRHNYREIKSMSNVDICWIEEAEAVSEESWRVLIPTIRKAGSEIWLTWNPELEEGPTNQRFVVNPPENSRIVKVNYHDNPWFPQELEEERLRDLEINPDVYAHIWEGETIKRTDAQVLGGKWMTERFEPKEDWDGPYFGMDFGFAQDPTALVKIWIKSDRLYVEQEGVKIGLELDSTVSFMERRMPGCSRYVIRADSSNPESINYLQRHGFPKIRAVTKWPGSVKEGIRFLRNFKKIIIHPRCKETIKEARLYSYKVDKRTGDILPDIVDAYNHTWDAVRYALEPMIKRPTRGQTKPMRGLV